MPKIIFAIDEKTHPFRTRARFLRHLDTLRAMGKLQSDPRTGIGHWVDDDHVSWLEPCYILDLEDFVEHVQAPGWVTGQQCVLSVEADACTMIGLGSKSNIRTPLGAFRCVGKVMPSGCWTRFDDTGDFWVAGNV